MKHRSKRKKLKIYTVIILILLYLPFTLFPMFLKDIPFFSSLVDNYIIAGRSFFIPEIPNINILFFLPAQYRITYFSIGHLLDIFIIINISPCIETIIYHYIVQVCNEEENENLTYMDNYIEKTRERFLSSHLNDDYNIALDNDLSYEYHIKTIKKYNINSRFKDSNYDKNNQNLAEYNFNKNQLIFFNKLPNSKLKFLFGMFCNTSYYSLFKNNILSQKEAYYKYPKIKPNPYIYSQWEGKS